MRLLDYANDEYEKDDHLVIKYRFVQLNQLAVAVVGKVLTLSKYLNLIFEMEKLASLEVLGWKKHSHNENSQIQVMMDLVVTFRSRSPCDTLNMSYIFLNGY